MRTVVNGDLGSGGVDASEEGEGADARACHGRRAAPAAPGPATAAVAGRRRRRRRRPVRAALAAVARRGAERQHRPPPARRPARRPPPRRAPAALLPAPPRLDGGGRRGRRRRARAVGAASPWPRCPLAWVAGRRLAGRPGARWAPSWSWPLSPFAVRYATETRMYSLVMLLVLAGYLLLPDALERPRAWAPGSALALVIGPAAADPLLGLLPGGRRRAAARRAVRGGRPDGRRRDRPGASWPSPPAACCSCRGSAAFLYQAGQHGHAVGRAVPAHRGRADRPSATWAAARSPRRRCTARWCWCWRWSALFAVRSAGHELDLDLRTAPTVRLGAGGRSPWCIGIGARSSATPPTPPSRAATPRWWSRWCSSPSPSASPGSPAGRRLVAGVRVRGPLAGRRRLGELLPAHPVGRRGRGGGRAGPARRRGRVLPRPARPGLLARDARRLVELAYPTLTRPTASTGSTTPSATRPPTRRAWPRTSWTRPTGTPCSSSGCPTTAPSASSASRSSARWG